MDINQFTTDILSMAALVAAFVGVAKGYKLPEKHTHALALAVATVFVLVPEVIQGNLILISVIGLTASGAYNYTKKRP